MSDLNGWPIVLNNAVPRPGAVLIDDPGGLGRAIVMHPDEEPHFVAMATGDFTKAFEILDQNIRRKIEASAVRANKMIDELVNEGNARQAGRMAGWEFDRMMYRMFEK